MGFAAEVEINVSQGQVGIMVAGQDNSTPQSAEAIFKRQHNRGRCMTHSA